MQTRIVEPFTRPAKGVVEVPGSKSVNNRALLLAALAEGPSRLRNALESEDSLVFAECLRRLGVPVRHDPVARTFDVDGQGGRLAATAETLFVANAGTAARFLMPLAALARTPVRFDGVEAMRARPMDDLVLALRAQGVSVTEEGPAGRLPLSIHGSGLPGGGIVLNADKSSQQVSALLLLAPYSATDTILELEGPVVSEPYIELTLQIMRAWGAEVERQTPRRLRVAAGRRYQPRDYYVEADASSASYLFAAAAVTGGQVAVRGLTLDALQGDIGFVRVLERMGCEVRETRDGLAVQGPEQLTGVDVDMNEISDTAPTRAAIAPFATRPVSIRGVEHMRWKETDRIEAMATELRRLGVPVETRRDGLTIPPGRPHRGEVATYNDHRIAMSLSIAGIAGDGVVIQDPECVGKTFANFFLVLDDLRRQSLT
jgi:3-phosphoshikimate 1-carboxyvinyltransferase